jgi:hypothetical protein
MIAFDLPFFYEFKRGNLFKKSFSVYILSFSVHIFRKGT